MQVSQMELKKNTLKEIENHFKNTGKAVRFVLPNENNSDLNDVLKNKGFNGLKDQMGHLMQAQDVIKITDKYINSIIKGINIDVKELINKVSNSYKINPDKINPNEDNQSNKVLAENKTSDVAAVISQEKVVNNLKGVNCRWSTIEDLILRPVTGVIIANEVLDAFPVERLVFSDNKVFRQ